MIVQDEVQKIDAAVPGSDASAEAVPAQVVELAPDSGAIRTDADDSTGGHGFCPLCGMESDDVVAFRDHLADEHDLYDDEGAETRFRTSSTAPPVAQPDALATGVLWVTPRTPRPPVELGRPTALIVLVIAAVIALVGALAFTAVHSWTRGASQEVAVPTAPGPTARAGVPSGGLEPPFAPPLAGAASLATVAPSPSSGGPVTTATGHGATSTTSPPPSTSTTTATTATTQPPASFTPPATSAARIDSCTRDRSEWIVRFDWNFVGGGNWRPLPSYQSLGGGRYRAVTALSVNPKASITTVQVVDLNGARHAVALHPVLLSSSC
jgi:hypothetical protein